MLIIFYHIKFIYFIVYTSYIILVWSYKVIKYKQLYDNIVIESSNMVNQ